MITGRSSTIYKKGKYEQFQGRMEAQKKLWITNSPYLWKVPTVTNEREVERLLTLRSGVIPPASSAFFPQPTGVVSCPTYSSAASEALLKIITATFKALQRCNEPGLKFQYSVVCIHTHGGRHEGLMYSLKATFSGRWTRAMSA